MRFPELTRDQMTDEQKKAYDVDEVVALFERAKATLGEQAAVDLIGVSGYYTLVSMVLNVAEIPLPPGAPSPW